jgi:ketosteroid isomerase-like protein
MTEESTTPDLVELTRCAVQASNHGEFDAALDYFAPDAVWSVGPGLERFEGTAAIRRFWTEWASTFHDYSALLAMKPVYHGHEGVRFGGHLHRRAR